MTDTPLAQFDDAFGEVNEERGKNYGHPLDNFRRAASMQAVISECRDKELQIALNEIAMKISRIIQTPDHVDSWIDIAGYARTGVMILTEREIRGQLKNAKIGDLHSKILEHE